MTATTVGKLLAATRTRDIADAHVVVAARRVGATTVVKSDPDDVRHLDPELHLTVARGVGGLWRDRDAGPPAVARARVWASVPSRPAAMGAPLTQTR